MKLMDRVKKTIEKIFPKNKFESDSKSDTKPVNLLSATLNDSTHETTSPSCPSTASLTVPACTIENQHSISDQLEVPSLLESSALSASSTELGTSFTDRLSDTQKRVLEKMVRGGRYEKRLIERSRIILAYGSGQGINQIAKQLGVDRQTVRKWCHRWNEVKPLLREVERQIHRISEAAYRKIFTEVLGDEYRSGAPDTFTPEQVTLLYAIACEVLDDSTEGVSHWTHQELANQMVKRGVVEHISPSSVGRLLQAAHLKPHKTRYWLNSPERGTESFQNASQTVCDLYQNAAEWHQQGIHVISTDEKTGIQALERLNPTQPMEPKVQSCERREHSYERHGTQTLIANFEVATGQVIHPTIGDTRTEKDFVEHIEKMIDTDPGGQWIFIVDQLNTHQSASLVEQVAERCNIKEDLGKKGKEGILESMDSRKQFLEDKSHRIRFVYTPKHASWLNQVEIWFSILTRLLLRRGSFSSIEKLQARILSFIDFFNKTMAKPFKWIYTGRPLAA